MAWVYDFENGSKEMKNLLGGKGANLSEMSSIGLPVPQGFTVSTEVNFKYFENGNKLPADVISEIDEAVKRLEEKSGQRFQDKENPLLVSVRSGAPVSMPGMMDTVLNLGINQEVSECIALKTGNYAFAYDNYRRFIQMYSDVVLEIPKAKFDRILEDALNLTGAETFKHLEKEKMLSIISEFLEIVKIETGEDFPTEARAQLLKAVEAVFRSWKNDRAILYRKHQGIPDNLGTAVNVQRMVFGNYDGTSGTGVLFSRDPSNGNDKLFGEFLFNAQGEDVVAGIRTPMPISSLKDNHPDLYDEIYRLAKKLEAHYKDVQDIEFTIERGKIYLLQTRNGKRTAKAAIKIAMDFVKEGIIDEKEALLRIPPNSVSALLHPDFSEESKKNGTLIAKGLSASPGAAVGKIYFNAQDIVDAKARGEDCILVRKETSPEDLAGMIDAKGILTSRGGMTSHAAVVARSMGKTCVAGCSELVVDEEKKLVKSNTHELKEGDYISIDGTEGTVFLGALEFSEAKNSNELETLLAWSKKYSKTQVRANADTPADAKTALSFEADGIGLCRTEHMFFEKDRIIAVREMILAENTEERKISLSKIKPFQMDDFYKILKTMGERPITVRLLDPPLHEFLPKTEDDILQLSKTTGKTVESIKSISDKLHEFNPMLGHRGCRLAMTYPEIYEMQTEALIGAACKLQNEGVKTSVEIMIPLVAFEKELADLRTLVEKTASRIMAEEKAEFEYKIGTMIEIPRACVIADKIAMFADFFSFGTNDLTQMSLGFSRDDVNSFMNDYLKADVFEINPFISLDRSGVGPLVKMAVDNAKSTGKDIKLGVCGEHGGDPDSIEFLLGVGLQYVSCSPYRIPTAKIASAQFHIRKGL